MTPYSNQISTSIPQQDLKEILSAIDFINKKLPDLVTLTPEEKSSLPKMKDSTIDFVYDCLRIAKESPEIVPKNVDVAEIKKDVELVQALQKILQPLKILVKKLKDNTQLAESEAYLPSMAIHNAAESDKVLKERKKEIESNKLRYL